MIFSVVVVQLLSCVFCDPMECSSTRLLCPWDFPGNTGVCCHFLLQGIFATHGWNPSLLLRRVDSLLLSQQRGISLMALCHVSDRHSQPKLSQVHQSITDPYPSDGQMPCHAKLLQFNTADCSSPGSPVHWSLQARILEWVAISCSRGSFRTRDRTHIS